MDCVEKLKQQGKDESSAWAICVSSTGLKPHVEKSDIPKTKEDLIKEHEHLVNVLESPSHEDDKEEAKKQKKELEEYKKADDVLGGAAENSQVMFKSDNSSAAFIPIRGASSVELETHIHAIQHEDAKPMLEYLKNEIEKLKPILAEKFSIFDIRIPTERGNYIWTGFIKEPGFYSGAVRIEHGETLQEIENDTLEIIASLLTTRFGKLLEPQEMVEIEIPIIPEMPKPTLEQKITTVLNTNGIDSKLNTPDFELTERLMNKPKMEIKVDNENEITITFFKSVEEPKMSLLEDLKKAFGDKKSESKTKKDFKFGSEPKEQSDESEDKKLIKDKQDSNTNISTEDKDNEAEENRKNLPIGGDDENTLPGANLKGNTGGIQAQEEPEEQENESEDMMGDNHEYVKMTQHAGGKQFWYRDPLTGKIIEKPNAPEGHSDFDNSQVLNDLLSKIEGIEQQLQQILGEEPESENMTNNEDQNLEQKEEELGVDLDSDNEVGESPEHQEKVLGKQKDKEEEQPEPDLNKFKKSLKEKYPNLSDKKIEEVIKKAKTKHDRCVEGVEEQSPEVENPHAVCVSQGILPEEPGKKEKDIKKSIDVSKEDSSFGLTEDHTPESENGSTASSDEEINKKDKKKEEELEKNEIKKSKLDRMWKVFKIDMPEKLEKSEDFLKANQGLQKLQKCILRQGKSESEANKIVNRAVTEKYKLVFKSNGYINFNQTSGHTLEEMQVLRKSDAETRFGIKQYSEKNEKLVIEKSSDINEKIQELIKPKSPAWGIKEYQEKIEKSLPSEHQINLQKSQETRWNIPTWKGSESDIKQMNISKSSNINERIQSEELKKSESASFSGKYKEFDENKTKLEKSAKTDSEKISETIIKRNWKE